MIIVKVKSRENTFKDARVRKQNVHNAIAWLINDNPHHSELLINEDTLNSLSESGVASDLMIVETDDQIVSDENCSPDVGPPTHNSYLLITTMHIHFNAPMHKFYPTSPT